MFLCAFCVRGDDSCEPGNLQVDRTVYVLTVYRNILNAKYTGPKF